MTVVSRGLMARDAVLGVTRGLRTSAARERFFFASGARRLEGAMVPGEAGGPVMLLCHGIGETVDHWRGVQAYLGERGIGSMVFDYSGYGRSSGAICAEYFAEDLRAAYAELRRRVGMETPVFVLGFSLGSGVAGAGVGALSPPVRGLFLCEAFTTFREAARATGIPEWLMPAVPDIWDTVSAVRELSLPVCVVHSEDDRLFPVEMARRIAAALPSAELEVVRGFAHDGVYLKAGDAYWRGIVGRVLQASPGRMGLD
jgi:pimeloyl-ACP methyl ester carboxylesterase